MAVVTPAQSLLSTYAHRYLMDSGVIPSLITQGLLGADPPEGPWSAGWVFRADVDGLPFRSVENTGKGALTLSSTTSWAAPAINHTSQFPSLRLSVFMDPTRDASGHPSLRNALERAILLWEAVHPLFHDPGNRIHRFKELPVVSTVAGGMFSVNEIPSGDGSVRGDIVYNLVL